jgi:MEDS: MEthanogen/methylotroph, DcmR Sensory domain
MVREIIAPDKIHNAIDEIAGSQYGSHYSIVYHNLKVLRNMYPPLIRQHLEVNNDTVLFLPFYDSTERARKVLSKNKVDVNKCENTEESLIIMDAGRAYFGSSTDIVSFIASLTNLVNETGKNGLSVFEDMGPFFYYNKLNDLLRYESSLSSSYKPWIKAKAFCLYNKLDYNTLVIRQKKRLLRHHVKEIDMIVE